MSSDRNTSRAEKVAGTYTSASAESLSNCSHLQTQSIDKLGKEPPAKRPPMMPSSWEKKGTMLDLRSHAHYREQELGI